MVIRGQMDRMRYPENIHRITKCGRRPIGAKRNVSTSNGRKISTTPSNCVDVCYSPAHETAHFGGLMQCGSGWACPVCSAKLSERRRIEIAQGLDYVYSLGDKKAVMITLTFPHSKWDKVGDLMPKQKAAFKLLRGGRPYAKLKHDIGYTYFIRSLEITYGESGWHPHSHELWVVDKDADPDEIRERVTEIWANACKRSGLLQPTRIDDFRRHAVHVIDKATSSDYMAKHSDPDDDDRGAWGVDRELASASSKRSQGIHPFKLLRYSANGCMESRHLYVEYVLATKGVAQIYWSKGFKAAALVDEKSDDELVEEQEEDAIKIATIEPREWTAVIDEEAQADILTIAEDEGFRGLERWFEDRGLRPPIRPRSLSQESPP